MELLRPSRRRTLISEILHVLLNIAAVVAIFLAVYVTNSPLAGIALVLLSKWRIFAVSPRYWYANLVSNMVDIVVNLGFVVLLYAASGSLFVQLAITLAFAAWQIIIKPQSKRGWVVAQAGIGLFIGVTALMSISYAWWVSFVVIGMWLIGYVTARHTLVAYKESHYMLLSFIWALVVAELGWLFYHWNFGYSIVGGYLAISQAAIIITLVAILAERAYASIRKHGSLQRNDILLPSLLTVSSVTVLLVLFNTGGGV